MKKILWIIFMVLFLTSPALSVGVHYTGLTPADSRCSFAANDSWLAWSGLDFSAYETGNWFVRLTDSSGYVAEGYAGVVGTGETLGTEEITNGDFSSATGWTAQGNWTIGGGVATSTAQTNEAIYRLIASVVGGLFNIQYDLVSRTSGSIAWRWDINGPTYTVPATYNGYRNLTSTPVNVGLMALGSFSGTADNYSIKQVTEPAATGIHILNGIGGSEAWAKIQSSFNYTDVVEIEIMPAATLAGVTITGIATE